MRKGNQKRSLCSITGELWSGLVFFPGQHGPLTTLFQKYSFPFSKKKSYTADAIHRKQTCRGGLRNLLLPIIQSAPIPPCNIRRRNRWSGNTGLEKRNSQAYENPGFGFELFSFFQTNFPIFLFGCPISTKGDNPENVA